MAIMPGSTIGILGGGQLGRMVALAARSMGYRSVCLDPNPLCSAGPVVNHLITAPWEKKDAFVELSGGSDVVTLEIENIPFVSLAAASQHAPLRPRMGVMHIIQDRARQKVWLSAGGYPLGEYRVANSLAELKAALHGINGDCYVKASSGGYDGRGQIHVKDESGAAHAWEYLGSKACVVEKALDLQAEISIMVARREGGECVIYPPSVNQHENGILVWSTLPGDLDPALTADAVKIASDIAASLGLVGLLAVEMFVLPDGRLLVNELAPRPHNSFHSTERGCPTSQFEQLVRAICDLPLGSVEITRPAAIANLLGEVWLSPNLPNFEAALKVPTVRLHLYEKQTPRPGRKMGHLSATGDTGQQALERVRKALVMLNR